MKGKRFNFLIVLIAIAVAGCSGSKQPKEIAKIEALKNSSNLVKVSAIRTDALQQTARGMAAQAGLSWRSRQLNRMLEQNKQNLDRIFNFSYLILNNSVLPPVLVEGRDILNMTDNFTIRVSDHEYQIIQTPRFITSPPNWRNYLWMPYKKPEIPNETMTPQNGAERRIWNRNIQIGWREGIAQADQIFSANLARLKRDFSGMILYRKLLAQNMVTSPYVSQADLGITGDGDKLNINDRILRITAIPHFQVESKKWRPAMPTKGEIKEPKQNEPTLNSKLKGGKTGNHGSSRLHISK